MANIVLKDAQGQDKIYNGITSIVLPTTDGKTATFIEQTAPNYVTGSYVLTVLKADQWTEEMTYTITTDSYGVLPLNLQMGLPPVLNNPMNAKIIVENVVVISKIQNYATSFDSSIYDHSVITFSAMEIPKEDILVAIWGIENSGGTGL